MKLVVSTKYKDLMKFMFSGLRYERGFPLRDGFLLVKNLSYKENQVLSRFSNYVVVSDTYFTEEWGREEIFEYCKGLRKSRRKPIYKTLHDDEFVKNVKVFLVSGVWPSEDIEAGTFELFKKIDWKGERFREYFKLREQGVPATVILYSVLTFISKLGNVENSGNVSRGYLRVLETKKTIVLRNVERSMKEFSGYGKTVEDDFRVVRLLMDLGGGYTK